MNIRRKLKTLVFMFLLSLVALSPLFAADNMRDWVRKYGIEATLALQGLEGVNATEGRIWLVDSGHASALDANDGEHGRRWMQPLATIDYAVGLCTDNVNDYIIVADRHNEALGNGDTIDFDVNDVTVIGIGDGESRPRIDYDHAAATIDIGADNVVLQNLTFLPSAPAVLIALDVESGATNFEVRGCEFMTGEAGTGADEFVVAIDLKSGNNDSVVADNVFRTHASAGGMTTGVILTAASARVQIKDNYATGPYTTAFIDDGATCTDILIENNIMKVTDGEPGIELTGTTTGIIRNNAIESTGVTAATAIVAADCAWFGNTVVIADGQAGVGIGSSGDSADDFIGVDNADNAAATTNVVTNDDGSVLERLQGVLENIGTDDADNDANSATVAANIDGSLFERLEDIFVKIGADDADNDANSATVVSNADGSILERLEDVAVGGAPRYTSPSYVAVSVDLTSATWNTIATHEVFTVTGAVRLRIFIECTENVLETDAQAANGMIQVGTETATDGIIAITAQTTIDAGEIWHDNASDSPSELYSVLLDYIIIGDDIGYEASVEAMTDGTLVFHCWWEPLNSTGAVVAGPGTTL